MRSYKNSDSAPPIMAGSPPPPEMRPPRADWDRAPWNRWAVQTEWAQLSKHAKVTKAIDYLLSPGHWPAFTHFLTNGRVCLSNNCAKRSLPGPSAADGAPPSCTR